MVQWLIYLTIDNLSYKIWKSQVRLEGIIVGLIHMHKKDLFDMKIEIYYQTVGVIMKN